MVMYKMRTREKLLSRSPWGRQWHRYAPWASWSRWRPSWFQECISVIWKRWNEKIGNILVNKDTLLIAKLFATQKSNWVHVVRSEKKVNDALPWGSRGSRRGSGPPRRLPCSCWPRCTSNQEPNQTCGRKDRASWVRPCWHRPINHYFKQRKTLEWVLQLIFFLLGIHNNHGKEVRKVNQERVEWANLQPRRCGTGRSGSWRAWLL